MEIAQIDHNVRFVEEMGGKKSRHRLVIKYKLAAIVEYENLNFNRELYSNQPVYLSVIPFCWLSNFLSECEAPNRHTHDLNDTCSSSNNILLTKIKISK